MTATTQTSAGSGVEPDLASRIGSMRFGFTGAMYPVPPKVPEGQRAEWQLTRAAELGCTTLQISGLPSDPGARNALGQRAADLDIELEGSARSIFVPLGEDPAARRDDLRDQLVAAQEVGMTTVRSGYGRLTLETTRFARERNTDEQLAHMVRCLKDAASIAEDVGLPVAVENHCDFTGREVAGVLGEVGSEWVGCAMDTANGYTVFCDPNDDVDALAEFTITTHMKDMRMEPSPVRGLIPILPRGCRLGDGHVDLERAVRLFAERSPSASGLHLIVEVGWETFDPTVSNAVDLKRDLLEHGVGYLRELIERAQASQPASPDSRREREQR